MTKTAAAALMAGLLCMPSAPVSAQHPDVAPLMTKELVDVPGKEVLVLTVDFPPGGYDPIHRHDAHGFIYVLEGTVVMQVEGGESVTLAAGETFYEGPNDIHLVGRNASSTRPARLLAVLVKNKGAPPQFLIDRPKDTRAPEGSGHD